jgi:hypothetical protein
MVRRKSLLIGCNYEGTANQLKGCRQDVENVAEFLSYRGYGNEQRDQVILTDANDPNSPFFPNGHNILAAIDWLVSEPGYVPLSASICPRVCSSSVGHAASSTTVVGVVLVN